MKPHPALVLVKLAVTLTATLTLAASTDLRSQQSPPQNEAIASAHALPEIHIDHDCRIFGAGRASVSNPNPKPRYRDNETVCHIESEHTTSFWDDVIVKGKDKQVFVTVQEREYVLRNTGNIRVAFIVTQPLPKNWVIDSEPQPIGYTDKDAIFRVTARPGEVVHLHVGERTYS